MRKSIELNDKNFTKLENTYVWEADISSTNEKSKVSISLLNYKQDEWTFAIYGIRGCLTTLSEGGIYATKQEAINKVNAIIKELFNILSQEVME